MDFRKIASPCPAGPDSRPVGLRQCRYFHRRRGNRWPNSTCPCPAHELVLLGPDTVRIHPGDALAIHVEGEQSDICALPSRTAPWASCARRVVQGCRPHHHRCHHARAQGADHGRIGQITAETLAPKAKIAIAGSGNIETPHIAVTDLDVAIAAQAIYGAGHGLDSGSQHRGHRQCADGRSEGRQGRLSIRHGRRAIRLGRAVKASIVGTGTVHVRGRAKCEISAVGSGKVVCEP
jgi:hypothetical protein